MNTARLQISVYTLNLLVLADPGAQLLFQFRRNGGPERELLTRSRLTSAFLFSSRQLASLGPAMPIAKQYNRLEYAATTPRQSRLDRLGRKPGGLRSHDELRDSLWRGSCCERSGRALGGRVRSS